MTRRSCSRALPGGTARATTDHRVGLTIDDVYDTIIIEPDELRSAPGADASDRMRCVGCSAPRMELIAMLDATALLDAAMAAGDTQGERT